MDVGIVAEPGLICKHAAKQLVNAVRADERNPMTGDCRSEQPKWLEAYVQQLRNAGRNLSWTIG